jgi:hypothetical protein
MLLRRGILGRLSPPFSEDEESSVAALVGCDSALRGRLPERSRSRDGGFGAGTLAVGAGLTDL